VVTKPGDRIALKHGVESEPTVRRVATVQKRRLLRQIGLRAGDLDAVALGYLDLWARVQSKVELYDSWASTHGYLKPDGSSPPCVNHYFAAVNASGRLLQKLEQHLAAREKAPESIEAWIEGELGRNGGDDGSGS
jgi:hypothetical protein